jgi:hypothetical protein
MSLRLQMRVAESGLEPALKRVLVQFAWFGADDGTRIFPSVERVAWLVSQRPRQTWKIVARLRALGVLERKTLTDGGASGHLVEYVIHLEALPTRPRLNTRRRRQGASTPKHQVLNDRGLSPQTPVLQDTVLSPKHPVLKDIDSVLAPQPTVLQDSAHTVLKDSVLASHPESGTFACPPGQLLLSSRTVNTVLQDTRSNDVSSCKVSIRKAASPAARRDTFAPDTFASEPLLKKLAYEVLDEHPGMCWTDHVTRLKDVCFERELDWRPVTAHAAIGSVRRTRGLDPGAGLFGDQRQGAA